MKERKGFLAIYVVNLVLSIVAIFSCAVYSKLTNIDTTGFVFLGIGLLAYAILLFVSGNLKGNTMSKILRIILHSALMAGMLIFTIVSIAVFASNSETFDVFEMSYALVSLIAFAFSVLNFVYTLINLNKDGSKTLYSLFNWCLFISLAGLFVIYVAQSLYESLALNNLLMFHGILTIGELLLTYLLVRFSNKSQEKPVEEPQA